MTKLALHSDLHLELQNLDDGWLPEMPDVLVLAGDILKIHKAADFLIELSSAYPDLEIIYVTGNHEYYGCLDIYDGEANLRSQLADHPRIHFLQCGSVVLNGIRFLGCTAWSEMVCLGMSNIQRIMRTVERHISDFGLIGLNGRAFHAEHCIQIGGEHRDWLEEQLAQESELPTVVVTHFSPTLEFRNLNFPEDDLTAYFCNAYDDLIKRYKPDYWFFGHTHFNVSRLLESTHVMSNQRGYGRECNDYKRDWIVEIP